MSQPPTVSSNPKALIESIARNLPGNAAQDFRNLMGQIILPNLVELSPGGNLLQPGGAQAGSSNTPTGVTFSVTGKNGVWTVTITDPSTAKSGAVWHEISYCSLVSFTKNVTTLPATTALSITVAGSGETAFFRMRTSFDRKTWSAYQLASTSSIDAGLVEANAMAAAAAFNQTNYCEVNSAASGGSATITINGTAGPLSSYPAIRGSKQAIRPSATIVGVTPSSDQFVGFDGTTFRLRPTLAGVLADNLEPVGHVSVVSTATPTLPVIHPVIVSGYVVGFNVISGGAGASQPYGLSFGSVGGGIGATFGGQTIVNGVLLSVAPGNPGNGLYSGGTTVTAAGGTGGGIGGGGTALGGNGGRLTSETVIPTTGGSSGPPGPAGPAGPPGSGDVNGPAVSVDSDFALFDGTTGKLIKDGGLSLTIDGTLAGDSDVLIPSEKAVKTYVDAHAGSGDVVGPAVAVDSDFAQFDGTTGKLIKDGGLSLTIDGTLAADLDTLIPSEKAVKTYVDNATAAPTGTANKVYATPNGAPGAASLRSLVMADLPASLQIAPIGVTLFATDVGKPQYINLPANCTIVSWTLIADAVGAASVDVWFKAGAAPPTAPPIPLVADKISAAAPIVLAAAQSSAGGAAAISTWTNPLTQWGMLAFNPTAMSGCTKVMIQLQLQRA